MSHLTPYSSLSKGTLLIASPEIDAGPFFRAVILICEHGPSGSFGLVINKPLDVELPEEIIPPDELQNPGAQIRSGGPLQPTQMMLIHSSSSIPEQTLEICKGVFLGGDLQFLQESASDSEGPSLLLCFGYAGWSPGQLEREFLSGMWFVCPANEKFVFSALPEKTWRSVLQEMGCKYATLSIIPEDLSLN